MFNSELIGDWVFTLHFVEILFWLLFFIYFLSIISKCQMKKSIKMLLFRKFVPSCKVLTMLPKGRQYAEFLHYFPQKWKGIMLPVDHYSKQQQSTLIVMNPSYLGFQELRSWVQGRSILSSGIELLIDCWVMILFQIIPKRVLFLGLSQV